MKKLKGFSSLAFIVTVSAVTTYAAFTRPLVVFPSILLIGALVVAFMLCRLSLTTVEAD